MRKKWEIFAYCHRWITCLGQIQQSQTCHALWAHSWPVRHRIHEINIILTKAFTLPKSLKKSSMSSTRQSEGRLPRNTRDISGAPSTLRHVEMTKAKVKAKVQQHSWHLWGKLLMCFWMDNFLGTTRPSCILISNTAHGATKKCVPQSQLQSQHKHWLQIASAKFILSYIFVGSIKW